MVLQELHGRCACCHYSKGYLTLKKRIRDRGKIIEKEHGEKCKATKTVQSRKKSCQRTKKNFFFFKVISGMNDKIKWIGDEKKGDR